MIRDSSKYVNPNITYSCISSLCGEVCFVPNTHFVFSHKIGKIQLDQPPPTKSTSIPISNFGTWLPKTRELVLVHVVEHITYFYILSQQLFYRAKPNMCISSQCPNDTIFLAHYVIDTFDNNVRKGSLLVFDILSYNGRYMKGTTPVERYQLLQQCGMYFPANDFLIQWAGDASLLQQNIKDNKFKTPHEIECVTCFTKDPMGHIVLSI
jgi:hypothetical protein